MEFPADDFFALIRSCYQKRAYRAEYKRLTFALVGVATPSDLIKDEERTPFNIGRAIQLYGFKVDEIAPLTRGFVGKVDNPQAAMREILAWTGGQPLLTQKICKLLIQELKNPFPQARRGETEVKGWVEGVVKTGIINDWEVRDEQEHFKTIQDRILANELIAVRLLGFYQQILQNAEIAVDGSPEQMKLRLTGLVVEQQGKLRVYNPIYGNIFDLNWVEKELDKLRPYADVFKAWIESKFQDDSYLLRGEDLQNARVWADGKSLSDDDYRFLSASVEAELNQKVAEAEAKQNKALEEESKANQRLTEVQGKTKRQIRIGGSILALFIVGAIVAAIGAISANIERKEAQIVTDLERSSAGLLRLRGNVGLENLVEAMRSVKELKQLVKNGNQLKDYPTVSPILALHNTLEYNREINQLKYDGQLNQDVSSPDTKFSPDTKIVAGVSVSDDSTTKLLNLRTGTITTLKHNKKVNNVVFSPDSKTVVTASFDGTAKLWNLQGQEITTLKHDNWVLNVAFSPDGKTIATGTSFADRTVRLWTEVKDGSWQQFAEYQGFAEYPGWSFVFRPDSKLIAIKVDDYFVQLRRVQSLDSSLARGCNDLKEYLASRPDLRKEICPNNK